MPRNAKEIEALHHLFEGHGAPGLGPTLAQLETLLANDPEGPLQFVNLLAFHDRASYPEGHELESKGLSGLEAYNLYGAYALRHVTQRGGKLVMFNGVVQQLIGAEGGWHQIAAMQYNDVDAFIDMIQDPDYQEGLVHRDAGLARTEIIVSRSLFPGSG